MQDKLSMGSNSNQYKYYLYWKERNIRDYNQLKI